MKQVRNTQLEFGKIRIENIELNLKPSVPSNNDLGVDGLVSVADIGN